MDGYAFRVLAGKWGAYLSGKRVNDTSEFPRSGRRLCRICGEPIAKARIESLLLTGKSFAEIEKLTTVPDSSIVRHFRFCLNDKFRKQVARARRRNHVKPFVMSVGKQNAA